MEQQPQTRTTPYAAPKVLEHKKVSFETMISSPGQVCEWRLVLENGQLVWKEVCI